jgi:hypothetical protein
LYSLGPLAPLDPLGPFNPGPAAAVAVAVVSNAMTAEGVMMLAAVEKSYSARTRSWNCLYASTMAFCKGHAGWLAQQWISLGRFRLLGR